MFLSAISFRNKKNVPKGTTKPSDLDKGRQPRSANPNGRQRLALKAWSFAMNRTSTPIRGASAFAPALAVPDTSSEEQKQENTELNTTLPPKTATSIVVRGTVRRVNATKWVKVSNPVAQATKTSIPRWFAQNTGNRWLLEKKIQLLKLSIIKHKKDTADAKNALDQAEGMIAEYLVKLAKAEAKSDEKDRIIAEYVAQVAKEQEKAKKAETNAVELLELLRNANKEITTGKRETVNNLACFLSLCLSAVVVAVLSYCLSYD